jgi:signal transduction histidine kinase
MKPRASAGPGETERGFEFSTFWPRGLSSGCGSIPTDCGGRAQDLPLRSARGDWFGGGAAVILASAWLTGFQARVEPTPALVNVVFTLVPVLLVGRFYQDNRLHQERQTETLGQLAAAHAALERYAAGAEELAVLRERNRLARELHGTLRHALSAIAIELEAARRVQRHDPDRLADTLGFVTVRLKFAKPARTISI